MEYITSDDKRYHYSYQQLRQEYLRMVEMSDKEFIKNLVPAIHLACAICFFKELGLEPSIGDDGVVHNLAHLMHIPGEPMIVLADIRRQFKETLRLD